MSEDFSSGAAFIEAVDTGRGESGVTAIEADTSHKIVVSKEDTADSDPEKIILSVETEDPDKISAGALDFNPQRDLMNAPPETFRQAVINVTELGSIYADNIEVRSSYEGCDCWLSEDGLCGFAVTEEGELINVFSVANGRGSYLMDHILSMYDSLKLNCFEGFLENFYGDAGFTVVAREENYITGEVNVVYMQWDRYFGPEND